MRVPGGTRAETAFRMKDRRDSRDLATAAVKAEYAFQHRRGDFRVRLTDDLAIELELDGIVRKRRDASEREPQYVWTNVELEWEEHHYIEVRYWASEDRLRITANQAPIYEGALRSAAAADTSGG